MIRVTAPTGRARRQDIHVRHGRITLIVTLALVFAGTLATYLACAAPSVMYGDSAELQAVALDGGIAHPTGYPTFIMLGRVFGAVLGGDRARRITVMSAIFGAAAVCAFTLVLLKLGLPLWGATAGALTYALSFTFFWSSIRTEVYTVAIFIFFAGLWLTLHALERPSPARAAAAGLCLGLVLTGHLTFAPAAIVIFLALILAHPAGGTSRPRYIASLAAGCIAGLLPYLYLFWADRAGYPMNYLDYTIETASGQYGLTATTFNDPWERIPWLIIGHQSRPTVFLIHLIPMIWQMLRVLSIEFIYHFGPLALPFFAVGTYHIMCVLHRRAWLVFGIIVASLIFGAGFGSGRMLQIFIIPSTIGIAVITAFGITFLIERIARVSGSAGPAPAGTADRTFQPSPAADTVRRLRPAGYAALALLVIVMAATPHLLRVRLRGSDTFPHDLKMHVEGEPEINTLIPRLNDFWEPRRYGERVLEIIPVNAFVIGKWKEIMVLYYLHYIEGARPDITLESYYREHYTRLNRWLERHDLANHPIVFLRHPSELAVNITGVDTLVVHEGQSIFICNEPFEPLGPPVSQAGTGLTLPLSEMPPSHQQDLRCCLPCPQIRG